MGGVLASLKQVTSFPTLFFKIIKNIERKLAVKDAVRGAKTSLHSFVVLNTPLGSIRWWKPELAS